MRCIEEDWTVVWVEKVEVRCILELMARLEDDTLVVLLLLLGGRRLEGSDDGLVKDVLESLLGQGRALDVLDSTELSGHSLTILSLDRLHLLLAKLAEYGVLVVTLLLRWAQIELGTDNQARDARAVVVDFGEPLLADVLKGSRRDDGEADEEDIGLRVRERTETVIILLTGSIEESEGVGLVSNHDSNSIVVKDSRHILGGELVGRV